MRLNRKTKWMAVSGAMTLIPLFLLAVWLWSVFPKRVVGNYFDSAGVRIHYTDEGRGTPLVLIHGFAINADLQWRSIGLTQTLSKDYRVIAPDLRGHGLSDKPRDPAMYGARMADDIVRLLDHLNIAKAHVVGYSFGGFVTLKLAAAHPERLLSAAVCGAGWEKPSVDNQTFAEAVAKALETGEGFGPLNQRLGLPPEPARLRTRFLIKLILYCLNDRHALAAVMRGGLGLAVTEDELRANRVPVLAMIGEKDGLRPGAEELGKRMANCTLVIIEGGGHMKTTEKPAFLAELQAFLAKHTPVKNDSALMVRPGARRTVALNRNEKACGVGCDLPKPTICTYPKCVFRKRWVSEDLNPPYKVASFSSHVLPRRMYCTW